MAEKKEIKTCAIYRRVSTQLQAKEGESLSTQLKSCTEFAQKKGWEVIEDYVDEGISGAKAHTRPAFMRMINDAKEGKFDCIVFTKLSRFARNAGDFIRYSEELKELGVGVFPIEEGVDPTSNAGKFLMQFMAVFAAWEKDMIRERTLENRFEKWKDGRIFLGRPPFGYVKDENKKLIINKTEAKIVKDIVSLFLDQGMSIEDIALKYRSKASNGQHRVQFTPTFIRKMFKNTIYYGEGLYNQFEYRDGKHGAGTERARNEDGSYKLKPTDEHTVYYVDPIIPKVQWERIQAKFRQHKHMPKHTNDTESWLSNLLVCGHCKGKRGNNGKINAKTGANKKRYYRCYYSGESKRALELSGHDRCHQPYIPAEMIENRIWNDFVQLFAVGRRKELKELFGSDETQKQIQEMNDDTESLRSTLASKKKQHEKTIERIIELTKAKDDELRSIYEEAARKVKSEIINLESMLNESELKLLNLKQTLKEAQDTLGLFSESDFVKGIAKSLKKFTSEDKRLLFENLIDGKITVWAKRCKESDLLDPIDLETKSDTLIDVQESEDKDILDIQLYYRFLPNISIFKRLIDERRFEINCLDFDRQHRCIILKR